MMNREQVKFVGELVISVCVNTVIVNVIKGTTPENIGKLEGAAVRLGKAVLSIAIANIVVDNIEKRFDARMAKIDEQNKNETVKA